MKLISGGDINGVSAWQRKRQNQKQPAWHQAAIAAKLGNVISVSSA
jgi:hypothetical protein